MPFARASHALNKSTFERLGEALELPSRGKKKFMAEVEAAVAECFELYAPRARADELRDYKLTRLADAGREFARALMTLDDESRQLIAQVQWFRAKEPGSLPDVGKNKDAARFARSTAMAADHIRENHRKTPSGRRTGGNMLDRFVDCLAVAWINAYGERPSGTRNGQFVTALNIILAQADIGKILEDASGQKIPKHIGERRVQTILGRTNFTAPKPKPGPKAR
jgi:hypothetical protein